MKGEQVNHTLVHDVLSYAQRKALSMSLSINSRLDRNVCVLTVTGQLTLGPHLRNLQQATRAALEAGTPEAVILDVAGVRYADSAGLGELTIVYSLCTRKQCPLVLASVPVQLRQMLELTRLDALLPSASDVDGAKQEAKTQMRKLRSGSDARADAAAGE
jgi:anti-anti-sigma factor